MISLVHISSPLPFVSVLFTDADGEQVLVVNTDALAAVSVGADSEVA